MNSAVVVKRIVESIHACENVLAQRAEVQMEQNSEQLAANIDCLAKAFSGSWLGYHSRIYYANFQPPAPGDNFSSAWGFARYSSNPNSENWHEFQADAIRQVAFSNVDPKYWERLETISNSAREVFDDHREKIRTILDILLENKKVATVERLREDIEKISGRITTTAFVHNMAPKGQIMSHDMEAMTQGIQVPPHVLLLAEHLSFLSSFTALEQVAKVSRSVLHYMEVQDMVDAHSVSRADKVFIGHGGAPAWRELKDFLSDLLQLPWEEYNREPTAGVSRVERLQEMLEHSGFALLVMTGEDEHADHTVHARENVIHEAGLFQGRLGFKRAIIVLEEGCSEFSNVAGLDQIRFPKGKISAVFEEVRRVLEREKII